MLVRKGCFIFCNIENFFMRCYFYFYVDVVFLRNINNNNFCCEILNCWSCGICIMWINNIRIFYEFSIDDFICFWYKWLCEYISFSNWDNKDVVKNVIFIIFV